MSKKSVGLSVVLWSEIIISARILLFTIPVITSKLIKQASAAADGSDLFIWVLTFFAFLYLFVGFVSLGGHSLWKMLHFVSAAVTLLLTAGLFVKLSKEGAAMSAVYYIPVVFGILVALLVNSRLGSPAQA